MEILEKIRESNRIENIEREPTPEEIAEFNRFLHLEKIDIGQVERFVRVYAPHARLRCIAGEGNVVVGGYHPPKSGPHIVEQLKALLEDMNTERLDPWVAHCQYENLHPFTDGNGRSGRMLWYWMLGPHPMAQYGFLRAFYYQTLSASRAPWPVRSAKAKPRADRAREFANTRDQAFIEAFIHESAKPLKKP